MNTITRFLSQYSILSNHSKKEFEQLFSLKHHKKGAIIAGYSQTKSEFFIIKEGIVCSYLNDQKGKKSIRSLFSPLSVIASLKSIIDQRFVNVEYHCLTDCTIYTADFNNFLTLVKTHHDISKLYNEILESSYAKLIERVTLLTTLEATERYLLLKKMAPALEQQITQYQIASYLNISPIQLSRIRKKIISN